MKVLVLISLALVVSVAAVPAPSQRNVKLPSDPSGNTDTRTKELYESYLKWKETLPEGSDSSFSAFISWVDNGRPSQRDIDTEEEVEEEEDLAQREQQNQFPIAGQSEDTAEERELQELSLAEMKANDFDRREQKETFPIEGETDFNQRREESSHAEEEEEDEEDEQGEEANRNEEINERFPAGEETDFSQRQDKEETEEEEEDEGETEEEVVVRGEIHENFPIEEETDFSQRQREEEESLPFEEEAEEDDVGQRDQREVEAVPLPASDESEKSESFDCDTNSPCTPDNIAKELFYFAAGDPKKFIQCSAYGSCSVQPCREGLEWNDAIKTCN